MNDLKRWCFFFVVTCVMSFNVVKGDFVFSFKASEELKDWRISSPRLEPLSLVGRYGTYGGQAFRFASPVWRGNMPQWPSCEGRPQIKDWRGYDRLVIDVTNPHRASQRLWFYASDSKVPVRKGWLGFCHVEGQSFRRFIFDVKTMPASIDRRDMSVMHFFTARPGEDMELFIGSVFLLRPEEALPALPSSLVSQVRTLYGSLWQSCRVAFSEVCKRLTQYRSLPVLDGLVAQKEQVLRQRMSHIEALQRKDLLTAEELMEIRSFAEGFETHCHRMESELSLAEKASKSGQDVSRMAIGVASSQVKVLPRDMASAVEVQQALTLELAQNEYESQQLVVQATLRDVQKLAVSISALTNTYGEHLASADVDVVGFVKTVHAPPYAVDYIGWWPDPLLRGRRPHDSEQRHHCGEVTIRGGDRQSFWLRFHAGANQRADTYRGHVSVMVHGVKAYELPIAVTVHPFCLPKHTPLPTCMSFKPRPKQMARKIPFDKMKFIYADFLADYWINYDQLYRGKEPDWDVLTFLHRQGRLTAFNLGYFEIGNKDVAKAVEKAVKRLRVSYEKARQLGLLDYAYIYGFDESLKSKFAAMDKCAEAFKRAFPEVLTITTAFDKSYGLQSQVEHMQAWCPMTSGYDLDKANKAREKGRQVWWYICCGPVHPYANWFIEYDAIEARSLMGAQTVKYRPDGFLYYSLSMWNDNHGIDCRKGPFTDWNPVSFSSYHGDGVLLYCDADGYPLSSIRLENYRDGLEDYAYARILEEAIRQVKQKGALTLEEKRWLKQAEEALTVPEELVKDLKNYSRNPTLLMKWRHGMATAIVNSRLKNLNPWKKVFY